MHPRKLCGKDGEMKPYTVLAMALSVCLMAPTAFAGLELFSPGYGSGSAYVTSTAYESSGNYVYEYVISGVQNANFSFFSVAINPGVDIISFGWDPGTGNPFAWQPVNNPPQSIEALFTNPIGPGETSSTLWFVSSKPPTEGIGSLAGLSGGQYQFAVGKVLMPNPEPATLLILTAGAILLSSRRKKSGRPSSSPENS